jgi:Zn ribbon nucleic-acid-binding protein
MTLYELAKRANVKQPQQLYNLAKQGLIKVTETECVTCGHKSKQVSDEDAAKYIAGRAARQSKKDADIAAQVNAMRAEIEAQVRAELSNNS